MVFLETFKGVAKKVLGVEVLGVCGEHFRGVSVLRVFEAISKGVSKQFQWSFRRVSMKFPGVSWKFKDYFKTVIAISKVFQRSSEMFLKVS